jgi:CxxC motif-containing protein
MEGDDIIAVEGNTCKRGYLYACNEVRTPVRTVTSTVRVEGGVSDRVSCKTKEPVPKIKVFEVMEAINKASCKAPVAIGDVLIEDCAGTGIPVVATKAVSPA